MLIFEAILLGIIQGLTEFLPVSSSGHLLAFGRIFDLEIASLSFDVALHFGTLMALLVFFRNDIIKIIKKALATKGNSTEKNTFKNVVIATIPASVFGFVLHDLAETTLRSLLVVALSLLIVGLLLIYVDTIDAKKKYKDMTIRDAWSIGLAQVLAFIPGVSRSGITMSAARLLGFSNQDSARFSFLIAIPIIGGATIKIIPDIIKTNELDISIFVVGIATSFSVGYLAIRFMLNYLNRHGLKVFGQYRIALAGILIIIGLIQNL